MHPSPPETVRPRARMAAVIALLLSGSFLLAGCAENRSNLLPGDTVKEISVNLDRVRELADQDDCPGAVDAAQQVTRQIEGLGTSVDPELRRSLRDGASRLVLAIQSACAEEGVTPAPETTPVDPTVEPDASSPDGTVTETGREDQAASGKESGTTGNETGQTNGNGGDSQGSGSGTGGETVGGEGTGSTGGSTGGGTGTGGSTGGGTGTGGSTGGGTGGVGPPGG